MRIALRTSGGRGEFELAGAQGATRSTELQGHALNYEIAPGVVVPSHSQMVVARAQGKPRLRLTDDGIHAYRLFAGILLLPKPIRELARTPEGPLLLSDGQYAVTGIDVDVVRRTQTAATLRPKTLRLGNRSGTHDVIPFAARLASVYDLWEASATLPPQIAALVNAHRAAVTAPNPSHKGIERAGASLLDAIHAIQNPPPALAPFVTIQPVKQEDIPEDEVPATPIQENDPASASDSFRAIVKQWRKVLSRGPNGRRFSANVKAAYSYRCLFSARTLPSPADGESPGVDAAHILPWASHGINEVSNGICLDKLCHWAYDAGLFRLDWEANDRLVLSVPEARLQNARLRGLDPAFLLSLRGPIPLDRLPHDRAAWPSRAYLTQLNASVYG